MKRHEQERHVDEPVGGAEHQLMSAPTTCRPEPTGSTLGNRLCTCSSGTPITISVMMERPTTVASTL